MNESGEHRWGGSKLYACARMALICKIGGYVNWIIILIRIMTDRFNGANDVIMGV